MGPLGKENVRKRVVVIDDEEDLTTYFSTILEENGFSVKTANNAVDGEKLIRDDPPDLICLDLLMPGKTGVNLFLWLRRREEPLRDVPLIIITGIKEQINVDWKDIVSKSKARVPDGFIEKPVTPQRLMRVVNNVLSRGPEKEVVFE
ncbi:MAG: response regulator with CheY-like receiver AAA-type ATPase and DNA-binding domain [bacterium]|nr:MAG: response regulator with CheY-like receiver AAA-type ATPase and DNA-binding domain [bacterium]